MKKQFVINKGLFFKEDFKKLPDDIIIYEKGVLIKNGNKRKKNYM